MLFSLTPIPARKRGNVSFEFIKYPMHTIYHALGLHMHQPPGNIELLLKTNEWEAKQIILCYERPLKYAMRYEDVAEIHLGFSGILLEQLCSPQIIKKCSEVLNLKRLMKRYPKAKGIEYVGMGYYHLLFPLIPVEDWKPQIERWKEKAKELGFARKVSGLLRWVSAGRRFLRLSTVF